MLQTTSTANAPARLRSTAAMALVALNAFCASTASEAAPTATRFELATQVQGTRLLLNGAGTRLRAIFKVYDMALYTPKKVATAEELLALPGAKRLQFTALRDLPGTDLGRLFMKGMAENTPTDVMLHHTAATTRLIEIFSARNKLVAGDSFAMEFIPGKGTQFYIQGQAQGEPVGNAEFFNMVLGIWVGASPADRALKEALLGRDKDAQWLPRRGRQAAQLRAHEAHKEGDRTDPVQVPGQPPAFASTTTDTPRALRSASAFWYECARLPGKASTSPSARV